ncbi:unnamed protein product [Arctogadus glacialis]
MPTFHPYHTGRSHLITGPAVPSSGAERLCIPAHRHRPVVRHQPPLRLRPVQHKSFMNYLSHDALHQKQGPDLTPTSPLPHPDLTPTSTPAPHPYLTPTSPLPHPYLTPTSPRPQPQHLTPTSPRPHPSTSPLPHPDLTPTSPLPHPDLTPTSPRPHPDLNPSTSPLPHPDLTPTSPRPHPDLNPQTSPLTPPYLHGALTSDLRAPPPAWGAQSFPPRRSVGGWGLAGGGRGRGGGRGFILQPTPPPPPPSLSARSEAEEEEEVLVVVLLVVLVVVVVVVVVLPRRQGQRAPRAEIISQFCPLLKRHVPHASAQLFFVPCEFLRLSSRPLSVALGALRRRAARLLQETAFRNSDIIS